jgi:hypothetical protein
MLQRMLVLCVALAGSACRLIAPAEADQSFEVSADGTEYSLSVGAQQIAEPLVSLLFSSPGSDSTAVVVGIEGPPGLRGRVDGARLPKGAMPSIQALENDVSRESYSIRKTVGGKEFKHFAIEPGVEQSIVQFIYHLQKDACARDKQVRYVSRILLDFSQVSSEKLRQGVSLRVALKEFRYEGSRVASIKPVADGKYRGEPILLMGTMQYGGEYVTVTQRGKRGVRYRRRMPVVKYVFHRGRTLSLARLRGILRGGRATFELSNGGAIYGVCFALERRRQVANGYPL